MYFMHLNEVRLIYISLRKFCNCYELPVLIITIAMQISLRHPCIFEYRYFWCYERSDFSEKINSSRDELQRSLFKYINTVFHNAICFVLIGRISLLLIVLIDFPLL